MKTKKLTKKEFKDLCSFHVYTGRGEKHNVIFYDWKVTDNGRGFKYGIVANIKDMTKKDLFDEFYRCIILELHQSDNLFIAPWWMHKNYRFKYAGTDNERFRVPLSLNF